MANKNGSDIDQYAHLEINKRKRFIANLTLFAMTTGITIILFKQFQLELPWAASVPGILLIGASCLIVPLSERWIYKPWQKTAQKVESTRKSKVYKF